MHTYPESIIAYMTCQKDKYNIKLPQPSPQFIEAYISAYNAGKPIENVLVEYDGARDFMPGAPYLECLHVDKNNYITITKEKDSWSREEVIDLLYRFGSKMEGAEDIRPYAHYDNWIKENL